MGAEYGFLKDKDSVSGVLYSKAKSVDGIILDTPSLYSVRQVNLQASSGDSRLPRRWALRINAQFLGFNDENGKAILISNESKPAIGDSEFIYDLNDKEFKEMIEHGLYNDPQEFEDRLNDSIKNKTFFKQSRVSYDKLTIQTNENKGLVNSSYTRPVYKDYLLVEPMITFSRFTDNEDGKTNFKDLLLTSTKNIQGIDKKAQVNEYRNILETKPYEPEVGDDTKNFMDSLFLADDPDLVNTISSPVDGNESSQDDSNAMSYEDDSVYDNDNDKKLSLDDLGSDVSDPSINDASKEIGDALGNDLSFDSYDHKAVENKLLQLKAQMDSESLPEDTTPKVDNFEATYASFDEKGSKANKKRVTKNNQQIKRQQKRNVVDQLQRQETQKKKTNSKDDGLEL